MAANMRITIEFPIFTQFLNFFFIHLIESIANTSIIPSFSQDSNIFRKFVTDDEGIHEL